MPPSLPDSSLPLFFLPVSLSLLSCSLPFVFSPHSSASRDEYDFDNPPQKTNIQEAINSVERDDPTLTELNLNNHSELFPPLIDQLVAALENNTYLESLSLANVKFSDNHAAVGRREGM